MTDVFTMLWNKRQRSHGAAIRVYSYVVHPDENHQGELKYTEEVQYELYHLCQMF